MAHLQLDHPNQRVKSLKPRKFCPGGSDMGDEECSVIKYTGTNMKDKKHSSQSSFAITKKARAKNGYVC